MPMIKLDIPNMQANVKLKIWNLQNINYKGYENCWLNYKKNIEFRVIRITKIIFVLDVR